MIELIEAPANNDSSIKEDNHISNRLVNPDLLYGEWGWTLCGLRKQLQGPFDHSKEYCSECLFRMNQIHGN